MRRSPVLVVGVCLLLAGCGSAGSATHGQRTVAGARPVRAAATVSHATVAQTGKLPIALQDAAVATSGQGESFLLMGGLDEAEASHQELLRVSATGASTIGSLPVALHDACAAWLGGAAYLFGGGQQTSFSGVTRVSATGLAHQAASLPTPASDVGCATVGETAYVVGGYTGAQPLRTILAWRPAGGAHVVATLPKPLRYAAVAATSKGVTIAGGTSGEQATREVYRLDPGTGSLREIARLPSPLTHAAAAAVGDTVLLFGGRSAAADGQRRQILAIGPSGQVSDVGELPKALSDMAAVALGRHVVLAGGRDQTGRVQDSILSVAIS